MPWTVSSDIHAFLEAAGDALQERPVENTVLLTEAAYLAGREAGGGAQRYGWWSVDDLPGRRPAGIFLQAPRHPPILSLLPSDALPSLVDILGDAAALGVDSHMVDDVVMTWRDRTGMELVERSRIRLYRLAELVAPTPGPGKARVATAADRELLVSWYDGLMSEHPDDPSDLSYVVDDPIGYGGILLWEVDGQPRAMAGRSRVVAGMVRLGPIWSPPGTDLSTLDSVRHAVLVAACAAAVRIARDVLIFAAVSDTRAAETYRALGFDPVLDRVMLTR